MHNRALKKKLRVQLLHQDLDTTLDQLSRMKLRRAINPLFSFFCSPDELLRWRAVTAAGTLIAQMADENMEDARVMMRRLMWTLNDESGGIGWGAPETMGEAMALQEQLAAEYAVILVSYLNPDGNFLEHEGLQCGLLWGAGRLAHSRPHCVAAAAGFLEPFLESADPVHRGLAAWCARALSGVTSLSIPAHLFRDKTLIRFYNKKTIREMPVSRLAAGPE